MTTNVSFDAFESYFPPSLPIILIISSRFMASVPTAQIFNPFKGCLGFNFSLYNGNGDKNYHYEQNISNFHRINQAINQLLNAWTTNNRNNQSINQSIEPAIHPSINQSIKQSINQSIKRAIEQAIHPSINRSIKQSINPAANPSRDNQTINRMLERVVNSSWPEGIKNPCWSLIYPGMRPENAIYFSLTPTFPSFSASQAKTSKWWPPWCRWKWKARQRRWNFHGHF